MRRHTGDEQKTLAEQQVLKTQQTSASQLDSDDSEQQPVQEAQVTAEEITTKETLVQSIVAFIAKLGVVCLALWLIFTFAFGIEQMHGETMYPRIRDGDLLLYNRMERDYAIGDVVVFKVGTSTCVARIVAQGGDVVELNDSGQLLVNGNVQEEEIFYPTESAPLDVGYPYTVDEHSYFMLSDFRTNTTDSRSFGAVSEDDFCGKVITILRRRGI